MEVLALGLEYFVWHYSRALRDIWHIFKNFLWFLWHFFSVPVLLHTFFAPWKRLGEAYAKGFDPAQFFGTLIVNTLMRAVGIVIRFCVLLLAAMLIIFLFFLGSVIFVVWLALPLLILGLFLAAIKNLASL